MKKIMIPTADREVTTVSISMPKDVVDDLEQMAIQRGMSSHKALIRYYVGKGLREDKYPTEPKV